MNKEELTEHLRKKGYDVVLEDGAVYVLVDKPMDKKERKKLGSEIEKADYRSSWGWRRKQHSYTSGQEKKCPGRS